MVGERPKNASSRLPVEVFYCCGEYGLLVKHILAAPLLEKPGEFRGREILFGGPNPSVVTPARCAVYIQSTRYLCQQNVLLVSFSTR